MLSRKLNAMPYPTNTPLGRFGIDTSDEAAERCVASIPAAGMVNPLTGLPTLAPLAMLVDHVGGLINHYRRTPGEWTVSSELSLEISPGTAELIAAAPDRPVVAVARPYGRKGSASLGLSELSHGDAVIATATVRSFHIAAPATLRDWTDYPPDIVTGDGLADRMALTVAESGGRSQVLMQGPDAVLTNSMGIVHGGVSAMGLELVASAAINAAVGSDAPLVTASIRVNYLRPFRGGAESRYVGTALRIGRGSGVADAQAIGDDGKVAIIARVTAYR